MTSFLRWNEGILSSEIKLDRGRKRKLLIRVIHLSVLSATLACEVRQIEAQNTMKPSPADHAGFTLIGIETRTNNAVESTADGAIPKQWQRLFQEDLLNRIPDRLDHSVIAVYTNYASDWNGDYTYILGAKVKPGTKVPAGMVEVRVPAGKYVEFLSARGPAPQVVPDLWKQIWAYFHEPGNPARAYKADCEIYDDPSGQNNIQVRIFIGVKP